MAKATPDELRKLLKGQQLLTLSEAARLLGIKAPNASRLRKQGRFPEPIVGGLYDVRELNKLKRELAKGRANGSG